MFENAMGIPPAEFDVRYGKGRTVEYVLRELRRRERPGTAGNPGWEYADKAFGSRRYAAVITPDAEHIRLKAQDFPAAAKYAVWDGDKAVRFDGFNSIAEERLLDDEDGKSAATLFQAVSCVNQGCKTELASLVLKDDFDVPLAADMPAPENQYTEKRQAGERRQQALPGKRHESCAGCVATEEGKACFDMGSETAASDQHARRKQKTNRHRYADGWKEKAKHGHQLQGQQRPSEPFEAWPVQRKLHGGKYARIHQQIQGEHRFNCHRDASPRFACPS